MAHGDVPVAEASASASGDPAPAGPYSPEGRKPFLASIDADQVVAYANATNDPNDSYLTATMAPPVFGVVPTWDATISALDEVVPPDAMPMLLHADQDMRFHRPLRPGDHLATTAYAYGIRPTRAGTWVTMRVCTTDTGGGDLVLEQFATMFVRGWTELAASGSERPDRNIPAAARSEPVAQVTMKIDADQTHRYALASGDSNRIHVDDDFARSVGLSGIILHGMCTMAFCGRAVLDTLGGGDPARLARLAVRFSKPVLPGSELVVSMYALDPTDTDAGPGISTYAFEATSSGERVIRDGLAEIRVKA